MTLIERKALIQFSVFITAFVGIITSDFVLFLQFCVAAIGIVSLIGIAAMAYFHWQYSRKHPGVNIQ